MKRSRSKPHNVFIKCLQPITGTPSSTDAAAEGSPSNTGSIVGIAVGVSVAAVAALGLLGFVLSHRRLRLRGAGGDVADLDEWMVVPAPQAGPATCIAVTDIVSTRNCFLVCCCWPCRNT
jgi:hypothetical protein